MSEVIRDKIRAIESTMEVDARVNALCDEYQYYDKIYFPTFQDSRGRVYFSSADLNPQAATEVKGLLQLAGNTRCDPDVVLEDQLWGLATTAAMKTDNGKTDAINRDLRIEWAEDHLDVLMEDLEVLENPKSKLTKLQLLHEFEDYAAATSILLDMKYGTNNTIIGQDATCSGLQILAALLGDRKTAEAVNLTATVDGQIAKRDLYQVVADAMMKELKTRTSDPMACHVVSNGLTRKIVKRPVNSMAGLKLCEFGEHLLR